VAGSTSRVFRFGSSKSITDSAKIDAAKAKLLTLWQIVVNS